LTVRVLHLASTLGPHGSPRFLTHLAIGLKNTGIEQLVVTIGEEAPFAELLREGGVPVDRLRMRHSWDVGGGRAVLRRIREYAPDVMHVWGDDAAWRVKVAEYLGVKLPRLVEPRPITRVVVPPVGNAPLPQTGRRLIVNVGRFDNVTDPREAVWIFDIVKHISPDYHLVIVGDGPQRAKVERFAASLSHGIKRVHFLGLRSDVPAILASAEVVLLTHHHGGTTVGLEAMAAGKPIVAWKTEAMSALLGDSAAGILASPRDRVGAASAVHRLLENPTLAQQLGDAGQTEAAKHTLTEQQLDGWIGTYRQVQTLAR
jgi:glycosyltransferase involved in cell wall biosynthesis